MKARPLSIEFDRYSLIINGERVVLRSGALHFFRLPGEWAWRDRLTKLKAAGYNAVDLYLPWSFHCQRPGQYDFSGIRDVSRLLEITQELGLWVIARPGPYINAELSGGGLPYWLIADESITLRNRKNGQHHWDDAYMKAIRQWWEHIVPIVAKAPNLLLFQVENEYATDDLDPTYLQTLIDWSRELGIKAPIFHNDLYTHGCYAEQLDIYAFDHYAVMEDIANWRQTITSRLSVIDSVEEEIRPYCQNRPLFIAEFQSGWFAPWRGGRTYAQIRDWLGRDLLRLLTKSAIAQGVTMYNHFLFAGGTNWGYLGSTDTGTSYDFAAPISEEGVLQPHYYEAKAINQWLGYFPTAATQKVPLSECGLTISDQSVLYAVRHVVGSEEARWIFLRNLSPSTKTVLLNEEPVHLPAYDVTILPWKMPLRCGLILQSATTEVLAQTAHWLVVKADRAAQVVLATCDGQQTTVPVLPLAEQDSRVVRLGKVSILMLGRQAIDQFWLEDGQGFLHADGRDADGFYGYSDKHTPSFSRVNLSENSGALEVLPSRPQAAQHPLLSKWHVESAIQPLDHQRPLVGHSPDMDSQHFYEGTALYTFTWPQGSSHPENIQLSARHLWHAWLNGHPAAQSLQWLNQRDEQSPVVTLDLARWQGGADNQVTVLVDYLGHPKGFFDDLRTPGGLLTHTGTQGARLACSLFNPAALQPGKSDPSAFVPVFLQGTTTFQVTDPSDPLRVVLPASIGERVNLYLNSQLVGRYWRTDGLQTRFYLPPGFLKAGRNDLRVIQLPLDASDSREAFSAALAEVHLQAAEPDKVQVVTVLV